VNGSVPFHVLTGHLGYQIEHHLFPDMPSNRYREIGPKIQAIAERYNLNYNTGPFSKQLGGVAKRILRMALPHRRKRKGPMPSSIHHERPATKTQAQRRTRTNGAAATAAAAH
jgi:linoleoyl-CoA desaturase